ncbi:hypothetical protein ABEB36_001081 [Hypothenemus hampei]
MLSSRTEMQRVIEQARTQSMAAFMLPSTPATVASMQTPLPAAVPQVIPAAVPEIKKDKDPDKKRDRRRSRSKSRDRRDRSRERRGDRKHRDRSRSKSKERRDRRRGRERSKSRNRSRDKDGRGNNRKDLRTRSVEKDEPKKIPEVWSVNRSQMIPAALNIIPPTEATSLLAPAQWGSVVEPLLNNNLQLQPRNLNGGGFRGSMSKSRENWPAANPPSIRENFANDYPQPLLGSRPPRLDGNLFFDGPQSQVPMDFQSPRNNNNNRPFNADRRKGRSEFNPQGKRIRDDTNGGTPSNACVSLEPFYGSYGDLRRFFTGLSINYKGIKIINDEFGHKTGVCFVQFRDSSIKREALNMNGYNLNGTEVKIVHISDKMFHEAIDRFDPRKKDSQEEQFGNGAAASGYSRGTKKIESILQEFICLKLEDLPSFVMEQDILHIFSQHSIVSMHLNVKPKGGTVGYVQFSNTEEAKLALEEKSLHVVRGKPVTVKPCTLDEFNRTNEQDHAPLDGIKVPELVTDCLSVSHLPAKTSDRDISDFFSDIGVIPAKIHLFSSVNGFTGQAYCEFQSEEDAMKGISKNNTILGQNTILVQPIPRTEVENILGTSLPHPGLTPGETLTPGTPLPPIKKPLLDNPSSPKKEEEQFEEQNEDEDDMSDNRQLNFEAPSGARFAGPPRGGGFFRGGPRGGFRGGASRFGSRGGARFGMRRPNSPENDSRPGCTIFMDNVPYKAGTDEILEFFDGFNCTNNVSRRYNPNNTPSAEAKVTFYSPDDAFRAVNELNGKKIWGRTIQLRQH